MERELTLEEKEQKVKDLRPIDDVFFEVLADDVGFCQEMLRIILGDDNLKVTDVIVQSSERNLYGRSVRLDALCILGNGKKCNVEVQRSDNDDHVRRVRFNAANIAVKDSQSGTKFSELEDIIVVYISETDIFEGEKVLYHVDSVIRETGTIINDGLERIFVNAEVKDGTTVSEFMDCFLKKEVSNPKFPKLTNRMYHLKHERGGLNVMCEVMQEYERKAIEEANVKAIKKMIPRFSKTEILEDYSEEEYNLALRELEEESVTV